MSKENIRSLSLSQIENYFQQQNQPKYRAKQLHEWLWQKHAHSFEAMTNVSKELRTQLMKILIYFL